MLYLMEIRNDCGIFDTNFMGDRVKSDAKYRREHNPLFSLAPLHFSGTEIRKRDTRESANLCVSDRWIIEACARAEMQRASTIASRAISLASRLHAVCLSITSVSLRLQGHLVLFILYQLLRSIARYRLAISTYGRLINNSFGIVQKSIVSVTFYYFMRHEYVFHNSSLH